MSLIRILVDSFADEDAFNAQMTSARDIVARLDPTRFHVTTFRRGKPDNRLVQRPATRLIQLPEHRQTLFILKEFIFGKHDLLFYIKPSPAARLYLSLRPRRSNRCIVIGTIESQSDLRNEPTIRPEQIRFWEQTVLRSDYLFSNSHSVKKSLKTEYGLSSEIVPTGVDTNFFTPEWDRLANSRLRVLYVGSLRPFKGPQLLVQTAPRLPQVDFTIIGDGMMAAELEERVRRENLTNVRFKRGIDIAALREEYRKADVFLFPSRWEGSPKVIMEAAACGLPVIARNDYQPETVVNGETGFLVGGDDELLSRLEELVAHPDLRRKMGHAARVHVQKFDWDTITRQWEEIFFRLAQREGAARHP
jgi:glycosyltransferase involved in cell wall biosynthesis